MAGLLMAVILTACMFENLHWPGGDLLLAIIAPTLLLTQSICLSAYVLQFGALKKYDNPSANQLRIIEAVAIFALALLGIAYLFRFMHWPGGAWLMIISSVTLAILSLVGGCIAAKMFKE